jgi:hypothetical protein
MRGGSTRHVLRHLQTFYRLSYVSSKDCRVRRLPGDSAFPREPSRGDAVTPLSLRPRPSPSRLDSTSRSASRPG